MRPVLTKFAAMALATLGLALSPLPAAAQMTEVDPNTVIDSDLDNPDQTPPPPAYPSPDSSTPSYDGDLATGHEQIPGAPVAPPPTTATLWTAPPTHPPEPSTGKQRSTPY